MAFKIFRHLSTASSSTRGTNMGADINSRTGKNKGKQVGMSVSI